MGDFDPAGIGPPTLPTLRSVFDRSDFTSRHIVALALGVGTIVFLGGYVVAIAGGFGGAYLESGSVYFVLFGTLAGLVVLLWGGRYHLRVWEDVRGCFDVSDERYAETLDPLLDRAYSTRSIAGEFVVALVLAFLADRAIGIPYAITIETARSCLFSAGGVCADHLSVINYLYGFVFLFVVVTTVHAIAHFLLLVGRMTDLPLTEVDTAAERLEPIAHFSIFVSTSLFAGVLLVSVVYGRVLAVVGTGEVPVYALVVTVVVAGLILVGLLVFWLPQIAIHGLISAAKQDRLAEITAEYDRLLEESRAGDGAPDQLSTELEILDARRRNTKEIETWSYNLPTLLPFVGSAVASSITWFVELVPKIGP